MGSVVVDQIGQDGSLLSDVDTTLSDRQKNDLLLTALPGAAVEVYAGERVVRFGDHIILKKQVTHLGHPWPSFKKRIQIPKAWLVVERQAVEDGLVPRFIGIYRYGEVTIFVDFDPSTYVQRKANNSAAHVATNDLYQAQTLGVFTRVDRNGNSLTSVRADQFADYLLGTVAEHLPHLDVFTRFNEGFLQGGRIEALDALRNMHASKWPDTFQAEWPGFYLEFRFDAFVRRHGLGDRVAFQKVKGRMDYDYDLIFRNSGQIDYFGDLKASNIEKHESPGNDAADISRCVREFGRFWYVIYEHETWHGRTDGDRATIAWNEWKQSVGYDNGKPYNPLSYATKFKASVRFTRMMILEINEANFYSVLGPFAQGPQPSGATRALKVMITKRNIDNFLVFSAAID
ncbi:hypothetical protein [Pedococcus sp. P5_B7]